MDKQRDAALAWGYVAIRIRTVAGVD